MIGERRHRVVFQRATVTQDAFGEPDQSWASLCTSWALVQPLKGAEKFAAMQVQADVDTRIVTRYRSELSDLGPKDRATWDGHTYDIKAVIRRDHRDIELEILAREHLT
jgi:SPP1 family predicted phage head-tail adaptor